MGPTRNRPPAAGGLLVVALVVAGLAGLTTVDPRPVEAAEPAPTAVPPTEAAVPGPTADCGHGHFTWRGHGFGKWYTAGTGWESTISWRGRHFIWVRGSVVELPEHTPHVISRSLSTLQGDRIAWAVRYIAYWRRTDGLSISDASGHTTSSELVPLVTQGGGLYHWNTNSGSHEVDQTGTTKFSIIARNVPRHHRFLRVARISWVKLDLRCGISIEATAAAPVEVSEPRHINAGDTVTFTYVVDNTVNATAGTGAASLTNVDVTHDLTDTTITCPEDKKALLKPTVSGSTDHQMTCTTTYALTQDDIDRGTVTAVATVDADDAVRAEGEADPAQPLKHRVRDSDSATSPLIPAAPSMTVDRKVATPPTGRANVDDTVSYSFRVTNNGNVRLKSVWLFNVLDRPTCDAGSLPLGPGDSTECTAEVPLTQAHIDAGALTAVVGATPARGGAPTDSLPSVPLAPVPSMTVDEKVVTPPVGTAYPGDRVSYSFKVVNDGNVTLDPVSVSVPGVETPACVEASIESGETSTCTAELELTQAHLDQGSLYREATITAVPRQGERLQTRVPTRTVTFAAVPLMRVAEKAAPAVDMTVAGPDNRMDKGDTVTYSYSVTNTGNVTLDPVSMSVPGAEGPVCVDASIGPGETATCTAEVELTQPEVDAESLSKTATFTATPRRGDGPRISVVAETVTFAAVPSMRVDEKGEPFVDRAPAGPDDRVDKGDTVTYRFRVTNTGNVSLGSVAVTGALPTSVACDPGSLPLGSGDSTTCTAPVELTQDHLDAGKLAADVTVAPVRGDEQTDSLETVPLAAAAGIAIVSRSAVVDFGVEGRVDVGDTVTYTFGVVNDGNVTLTDVRVSVPGGGGPVACPVTLIPRPDTANPGAGERTCEARFVLTQGQVDRGVLGPATVSASPPVQVPALDPVSAVDTETVALEAAQGIRIVSRSAVVDFGVAGLSGRVDVGDTVTYTYRVVNDGNVTLTDVRVSVPGGGPVTCLAALGPGAGERTCEARFVLTQGQVDRGVLGPATVSASPPVQVPALDPVSAVDSETVALEAAAGVAIDKVGALDMTAAGLAGRVDVDDTVTYTYRVVNTGNVTLTDVTVQDPDAATVTCGEAPLAPGDSRPCPATGVVKELTQGDVDAGRLQSAEATVSASPPVQVPALDPVSAADTETVALTPAPAVSFDKTADAKAPVREGDKVTYSFKATNTGNVTLTGLSVFDPKVGEVTCPETTLAPKAATTCTAVYTVTPADTEAGVIENRATVTAEALDETVTAADSVSISTDPGSRDPGKTTVGRIAGPERYSTAVEISKATFAPGVKTVYIATGVNFPDALAGSAASGGDGPILLITKHAIPTATLTELRRLKPKQIIVLGGTGVVSAAVEPTLQKQATTTRQAGSDRYSTAAAISAEHFDPGAEVAFVATGEDFPDALTGGPAAAKLGGPILLTQKAKLPSVTAGELRRLKPKHIVVLGGTGVVSAAVENALAGYTAGKVSRLAGADRYSTGGAISKHAFDSGVPIAYVATGLNFPDALAGGAAGAFQQGPVLLVAGDTIPKATAAELTRLKPRSIVVLGGTAVVPESLENALDAYLR